MQDIFDFVDSEKNSIRMPLNKRFNYVEPSTEIISQAEAGNYTISLAEDFGATISQITLVGAIVFLPVGLTFR